jgi:zinc protease
MRRAALIICARRACLSRSFRSAIRYHGYTYGARSSFSCRRSAGPFVISAAVRIDATATAVSEVYREMERLRDTSAAPEELSIAKEYLTRSLTSRFQTVASSARSIGELFVHNLNRNEYQTTVRTISAVSPADVQRAAKYLQPESIVTVAVGDATTIEDELRELNLGSVNIVRP